MTDTVDARLCHAELASEFVDSHLARRERRAALTLRSYAHTLPHFFEFIGWKPLDQVTVDDIEEFGARATKSGKPRGAATSRREIVEVKKFLNWCLTRKGIQVTGHLIAMPPKVVRNDPKPVRDEVWLQLWGSTLEPDDVFWLGLGFFVGMRRYEIVSAPPQGVNLAAGTMRFVRKGGRERSVEYRDMYRWITAKLPWLTGERDWLTLFEQTVAQRQLERFLWPHSEGDLIVDCNRLNKRLERLLVAAGLPGDAFSPHGLRHSCATNLLRAGTDSMVVAKCLSHESTDMTMRYADTVGHLGRLLEGTDRQ
jgi:integrase/recombinase XerD